MNDRRKTQISSVSEVAWQLVQEKVQSFTETSRPVPLNALAGAFQIARVRFEPLLSGAGLRKAARDWEIVINTQAPTVRLPPGSVLELDDAKWSEFKAPIRFSIAHEIAHKAFLNAAQQNRPGDMFRIHEEAIENACNVLARILLLPRHLINRDLVDRFLDIDLQTKLISDFRVSPWVWIRRFNLSDFREQDTKPVGFIALAKEDKENNRLRIKACQIWGGLGQQRFDLALRRTQSSSEKESPMSLAPVYRQANWGLNEIALNDLRLYKGDLELMLRREDRGALPRIDVQWSEGKIIPCSFVFSRICSEPLSILVSVQILGPVQTSGENLSF